MKTILLFISIVLSLDVFAWGDLGHKTISYLAEKKLSEKAKGMVADLLGEESLVVASVFADQVRGDERFDRFKPYHYVDLNEGEKIAGGKNAHGFIQKAMKEIAGKEASIAQKRFLLRYLIHIIGDVHQPLHVGNGMDLGGNTCGVNWKNPYSHKTDKINLHLLWDEKIFDYYRADFKKGYFDYKELAEIVEAENAGVSFEEKVKLPEEQWYSEIKALHAVVYPEGKTPSVRAYCDKNKAGKIAGPILSEAYMQKALKTANTQLMLAAQRLAVLLNNVAESYKKSESSISLDTLLKSVETILEK